jgi:gliding motility-associated lipoprotein GldD
MKKYSSLILVFALISCGEEVSTPRPRAYPRIEFPTRSYKPFDKEYCHFTFEMPSYTVVEQDTSFFGEKPDDPCWFSLNYPQWGGSIYMTYKPLNATNTLDKLANDSYNLTNKHNVKADAITDYTIKNANGLGGVIFEVEGNVASFFQFYLTDSTKNYVRGAMYFRAKANADSLAPAANFVKEDVLHIINTFKFNG